MGFIDRVIGVAHRAVHVRDGVARRAGDPGPADVGCFSHVEIRVVKRAAQERHHIVAARTPARGLHVAIAPPGTPAVFPSR